MDEPNRNRVQKVQLLATRSTREDETRSLQHLQVLHHAETRHLFQLVLKFQERASIPREQQIKQEASCRVGKSFEDLVVIAHPEKIIGDQMVTCQAGFGGPRSAVQGREWRSL